MKYNTCTLSNGLRVIHLPSTSHVVYCGYGVAAGARHESENDDGIAHFCEHMSFKGTQRRKAFHIINALERVGGDLNAFTNKEDTFFYASVMNDNLPRAVDLLSDMVFHSVYPQQEIDKEVEIICDEIESYHDSPAELIYDEFENLVFSGHPLGHNILGEADRVRCFTTADAHRFVDEYYRPERAVFFAYGNVDFDRLVKCLCKAHGSIVAIEKTDKGEFITISSALSDKFAGQTVVEERHTHQAHVMIGNRTFGIRDPRRIALFLLNNILGGPGMNARLNMSLRERNGLVYTVESSMASYGDTGLWATYFGCDPHDIKRCIRLVKRELDRVRLYPLTDSQLANAKRQLKGQIGIACDNRESFALDFAKSFLHYGWEKDVERLFCQIDNVSASDIQQVAQTVFDPSRLTTLIYK